MKSTIVPAQITTVEDKVAGNLSLSQLLLLSSPVFIGSAIYIVLPPSLGAATYKLIIIASLAAGFSLLAIRIRGRLLASWLVTIGRYNLRPRHYVFNKNDMHLRDDTSDFAIESETVPTDPSLAKVLVPLPIFSITETVLLEGIMANSNAKMHFKINRKGALNVHITQVK